MKNPVLNQILACYYLFSGIIILLTILSPLSNAQFCQKRLYGTFRTHTQFIEIGDVNGDGLQDYFVSVDTNVNRVPIIFGRNTSFPPNFNITLMSPPDGLIISSTARIPFHLGVSGAPAGDWNGDGIDDFVVSAYAGGTSASTTGGKIWVVFGRRNADWANFDIETQFVSGTTGQFFVAGAPFQYLGYKMMAAADYNDDGNLDLLVPAPTTKNAAYSVFYIVFGGRTTFEDITLSTMPLSAGITLSNIQTAFSTIGISMAPIGDFDKDGKQDFVFCNHEKKYCYVLFGRSSSSITNIDVSTMTYPVGIKITSGAYLFANSVSRAGDFNKDGYSDFIVSTNIENCAYLILGNAAPTGFSTETMTPSQGVKFCSASIDNFGAAVVGGLDYNEDGYDDVIIGSYFTEGAIIYGNPSPVSLIGNELISTSGKIIQPGNYISTLAYFDMDNDGFSELYAYAGTRLVEFSSARKIHPYCEGCSPNAYTTCTACAVASGSTLKDGTCKCSATQYEGTSACILCSTLHPLCTACSDENTCTACSAGAIFSEGNCLCPDGEYLDGTSCSSCSNLHSLCTSCSNDGVVCNACSGGASPFSRTCICPTGQYLDDHSQLCKPICPSGEYFYQDGSCLASCGLGFITRTEGDMLFCDQMPHNCTSSQYFNMATLECTSCDPSCLTCTGPSSIDCSSCGESFVLDNGECVCPNGSFIYQNGSCLLTCPSPFIITWSDRVGLCNLPCRSDEYLHSSNNTCQPTCNYPLKIEIENGIKYCNYPCLASEYLYPNATCLSTCTPPYTIQIEASDSYCIYQNSISQNTTTPDDIASIILQIYIRYDISLIDFNSQDGLRKFIQQLASVLGVHPSAIIITGLREGSTVIEFEVPVLSAPDQPSIDATVERVQTMSERLSSAIASNNINVIDGVNILDYKPSIQINHSQVDVSESSSNTAMIALGVGLLAAVMIGGYIIYRKRKNRRWASVRDVLKTNRGEDYKAEIELQEQTAKDENGKTYIRVKDTKFDAECNIQQMPEQAEMRQSDHQVSVDNASEEKPMSLRALLDQ